MQHSTQIPEIEKLQDFNYFAWHCALQEDGHDILTLSKIEGGIPAFPERFFPPSYALEYVVKGTVRGKMNGRLVELQANTGILVLADHVLTEVEVSPDCEFYVLGFSTQFADRLNIHIQQDVLTQMFVNPIWHMTEPQMQVILQYINLLRTLIEVNKPQAITTLVRSMLYNQAADYEVSPQQANLISRVEQICGQYLSLVEVHCREQHTVEWYASQMCLAPKYLSNVVKQTLGSSPNKYIDEALTRQAKSLLSSTSLSIQQISDRLGFQNQSHFGTFFKRQTGLSPKAFKQQVM
jgi:AraC-like DNA-binding protein